LILSGEETQRGQRLQAYFGYLNQARQETIAQLKQTREEVATQKRSWKRSRVSSKR
jgi:septal ring factor EnvC (AmiA/AmiB activator)